VIPRAPTRLQAPGSVRGPSPFPGLTRGDASRSCPRIVHGPRHTVAQGGIRVHIREDPGLSVSAGDGVFGHLILGAPGRIRTCAHGSGVVVRITHGTQSGLRRSRSGSGGDTGCVGGVSDAPRAACHASPPSFDPQPCAPGVGLGAGPNGCAAGESTLIPVHLLVRQICFHYCHLACAAPSRSLRLLRSDARRA
jgi:hypothetical protein